jgi:hypothetical protein
MRLGVQNENASVSAQPTGGQNEPKLNSDEVRLLCMYEYCRLRSYGYSQGAAATLLADATALHVCLPASMFLITLLLQHPHHCCLLTTCSLQVGDSLLATF